MDRRNNSWRRMLKALLTLTLVMATTFSFAPPATGRVSVPAATEVLTSGGRGDETSHFIFRLQHQPPAGDALITSTFALDVSEAYTRKVTMLCQQHQLRFGASPVTWLPPRHLSSDDDAFGFGVS